MKIEIVESRYNKEDDFALAEKVLTKYWVSAGVETSRGTTKMTDDPSEAIRLWYQLGRRFPYDVAIFSLKKSDALDLIRWASENREIVEKWHHQYNSPYRLDYMLNNIDDIMSGGFFSFYESDYGYGDQIPVFSYG